VERIHIAVAEDNPSDLLCLKEVLDQLGVDYTLTIATDGEEARDFILKHGRYRSFPPADIIFLDMNMPKLTGLEVLRQIPNSAELPVCLLTSSERERQAIEEHFAPAKISYLIKPVDEKKLLKCLRSYDHLRPVVERLEKH
jgi:CheY-like chemotaxis protein